MTTHPEYLLSRIASLASTETETYVWDRDDVREVGLEVAAFIGPTPDLPRLEQRLTGAAKLDATAIETLAKELRALGEQDPPAFDLAAPEQSSVKWTKDLERLEAFARTAARAPQLSELEIQLSLSLKGDGAVDNLLSALPEKHEFKDQLREKLSTKLALLRDEDAVTLWAMLRMQVDPTREVHYELESDVVPTGFFDFGTVADARQRIARYLAEVRPALERRMREKGGVTFPMTPNGVVTILSWTDRPDLERPLDPAERATASALCRWFSVWTHDKNELAKTMGVSSPGYFVDGRGAEEAKRARQIGVPPPEDAARPAST